MNIFRIALSLFLLNSCNSLTFPKINYTPLLKANEKIYQNYDTLGDYKGYFEPNMFSTIHDLTDTSNIELVYQHLGKETVKYISSALPHVDSIGHQILHANNIYINNILNNPNIPHDLQKILILTSIKLAQYGDDFGSELLQFYYNIVDNCL